MKLSDKVLIIQIANMKAQEQGFIFNISMSLQGHLNNPVTANNGKKYNTSFRK